MSGAWNLALEYDYDKLVQAVSFYIKRCCILWVLVYQSKFDCCSFISPYLLEFSIKGKVNIKNFQ